MKNFEEIKKRAVLLGGLVLMFLVGFGTGDYVKLKTPAQSQTNYTTKTATAPFLSPPAAPKAAAVAPTASSTDVSTSTTNSKPVINLANCLIKGNIAADGRKIYHVPGGQSYKRLTHPKQCFNTEAEAVAAGFVKAKR